LTSPPNSIPSCFRSLPHANSNPNRDTTEGDVGDRESIVVAGQHELAVEPLGSLDLVPVDEGAALGILAEIGPEPP
jgi:hypothetical protein